MPFYEVTVDLNSHTFTIEAENEEMAGEKAYDILIQESSYSLLRHANYLTAEVEESEL
jgi:HSP20 family molecular chaperone IbpA